MSSKDKLIAKIESSKIRKDVTLEELTSYLGFFGIVCARTRGSHRQFIHRNSGKVLTVASHNNCVKACYIRDAVRMVEEIKEGE